MIKIKIITIIILSLLITGCGDYRELTDLSIVSSIGLDKINNEYEITVQILDSKKQSSDKSNSDQSEIIVYSATGKTTHEAFRNAILESPKKLYGGHVETVIISESAAKENVSEFFDFFLRDAELSKDFNVVIAKDYGIKEIMNILTPLETIPAENISSSIETSSIAQGSIVNISFDKFVSDVVENGIDAILPVITIINIESYNENINPSKRLILTKNLASFDDYKFLTYLNENASIGYNLIKEGTSSSVISFKCSDDTYAAIELVGNKTSLSFDVNTNTIKINMELKSALSELNCDINLEDENEIKKLEEKAENTLKIIINDTIDEAKKYNNSDFLGIGLYIFRNYNNYYKDNINNIDNIIKNMNRDIKIDIKIIQKGSLKC